MTISTHILMALRWAAILGVALPAVLAGPSRHVSAASSLQALVSQAEHNTNTVRTLVHQDTDVVHSGNITLKMTARGAEDEVRNREQDYESVRLECHNAARSMLHLAIALDYIVAGIRWDPDRGDNLVIFEKTLND